MVKVKLVIIVTLIILGGFISCLILSRMSRSNEHVLMSKISGVYTYSVIEVNTFDSFGNNHDSFYRLVMINGNESELILLPRFTGRPISLSVEGSNIVILREVDGGLHKDVFRIGRKGQISVEFIPR